MTYTFDVTIPCGICGGDLDVRAQVEYSREGEPLMVTEAKILIPDQSGKVTAGMDLVSDRAITGKQIDAILFIAAEKSSDAVVAHRSMVDDLKYDQMRDRQMEDRLTR